MSAAVNTQFVDGADCGETCLGRPCNYWVDEDMASCAELLHVSSCSGCEECTVCAGAPSDDNFVVVALGVFCGVLSVVVIIMMVFVCLRSRNTLSGQVRTFETIASESSWGLSARAFVPLRFAL